MGRRREFDADQALEAALCVFWRKGYEGTSYSDLTQATGVERPGLYAAFGNKEALFGRALERYNAHYLAFFTASLTLPTSREVVTGILRGAVDLNTRYPDHLGCLGINGVLAGSDDAETVRLAMIDARATGELALADRLERAKEEGDLPASSNSRALAAYVCAVLHGIAVQAKAGHPRDLLEMVVEHALSTWPSTR